MDLDSVLNRVIADNKNGTPAGMRCFIQYCGNILSDKLPNEAKSWLMTSCKYDNGEIDESQLNKARKFAWEFHDAQRDMVSNIELAALRVAMYGLWPNKNDNDWDIAFEHLIEFCKEAGIKSKDIIDGIEECFYQRNV